MIPGVPVRAAYTRASVARVIMVVYEVYARDARVRRHSRALVNAGHDVEVLAVAGYGSVAAAKADGVKLSPVVARKYRGAAKLRYVGAYAEFAMRLIGAIARRSIRNPPQIVYVNNPPDVLIFAAWPARLRGAKLILDVHDMTSELFAAKFADRDDWVGGAIRLSERLSYRYADGVVTVADAYQAKIEQLVGRRVPVATVWNVPDGSDWPTSRKAGVEASDASVPLRLGHHGTIVERFGIDRAVEAVAELRGRGFAVTLEILGNGDFADTLEHHIRQANLEDVIRFHRRTFDHGDLLSFAKRIDIGIAPYRPSEFIGHSLPTKVLEYLALGVPTIVTETEMIRAYLRGGVRTVPTGTCDELVDAILELSDPKIRGKLRSAGLTIAARYGWPQQRTALLEFIRPFHVRGEPAWKASGRS